MSAKAEEFTLIQDLSKRIVDAQSNIRILDQIKWDDTVKSVFFKHKAQKLPEVNATYYQNRPLPFDVNEKMETFRQILRDAQNQLGQYSPVTRLMKRQCD